METEKLKMDKTVKIIVMKSKVFLILVIVFPAFLFSQNVEEKCVSCIENKVDLKKGDIALGKTGEKFLLHSRFWIGDKFMIVPQNNGGDWDFDKSFVLFDNGNVGIGAPNIENATARLTVNGNILAKEIEIKIDAGEGADFVFDDDYNLPKLYDLENFVKEHNHLPQIPSAKDMQENGLKLGDMQLKLLQKVEELTLYIIEQNKKIVKLEGEVDKLRGE
jgi:hypothetical protein